MTGKRITLEKLTGLSNDDLADVFSRNPRAYMAVKGAVAEKHLEILLSDYVRQGVIKSFISASSDFDKDFCVTLNDNKIITLECKNVQVLNTSSKKLLPAYIKFLVEKGYLKATWLIETFKNIAQEGAIIETNRKVNSLEEILEVIILEKAKTSAELIKFFPQELRESGVPRYEFSASLVKHTDISNLDAKSFLNQFQDNPLSIDFQRTRNSTDKEGDNRKQRLYCTNEIDVVGACLFSRTMKWQFLFGHSRHFTIHNKYEDRYANKFVLEPGKWSFNLIDSLNL